MHIRAIPGRSCLVKVYFCLSELVLAGNQGFRVFHLSQPCAVGDLDESDGVKSEGGDGDEGRGVKASDGRASLRRSGQ